MKRRIFDACTTVRGVPSVPGHPRSEGTEGVDPPAVPQKCTRAATFPFRNRDPPLPRSRADSPTAPNITRFLRPASLRRICRLSSSKTRETNPSLPRVRGDERSAGKMFSIPKSEGSAPVFTIAGRSCQHSGILSGRALCTAVKTNVKGSERGGAEGRNSDPRVVKCDHKVWLVMSCIFGTRDFCACRGSEGGPREAQWKRASSDRRRSTD